MKVAARAIIIKNSKILLMRREKEGFTYYTLVGGAIQDNESKEEGLIRELAEETGLKVTSTKLVFIENHPLPYSAQYTYLCEVDAVENIALGPDSEEALLNKFGLNIHTPIWVDLKLFPEVPFRTVQLQDAIIKSLENGWPNEPISL